MAADPLGWIADELASLERQGLRRHLTRRIGPQGPMVRSMGTTIRLPDPRQAGGERTLVNLASNDYLSLASDHRLIEAAAQSAAKKGWGAGASPLVSGYSASHVRLEARLAELLGTEAALVMPSGFAANVGTICAGRTRRRGVWRQ